MKRFLAIALVACGGGGDHPSLPDGTTSDATSGDAAPTCSVFVTFDPPAPLAYPGSRVRAIANVTGAAGVPSYSWQIRRGSTNELLPHEPGALDNSAVDFAAATADSYDAIVQVSGTGSFCNVTPYSVNVEAPGANTTQLRVRVFAPASFNAPPMERRVLVKGNTASYAIGVIPVEAALPKTGTTGAHAYVRFIPQNARETVIETFTETTGAYSVRLVDQLYDVLLVPLVPGLAPRLVKDWLPGQALPLDAGTPITGVVRDHDNNLVANAKVQLVIDGVATSLATTQGDGAFTVHASTTTGPASIEVTAPAATGLPRLVASSSSWTYGQPIQVKYADPIQIVDLAGATVVRNGNPQMNARVTLVGTFPAGTITAGTTTNATGEVRATAIANSAGIVPTLRAPNQPLLAVVSGIPGGTTASPIDVASQPTTIDALPNAVVQTVMRDSGGDPLDGAIFEAVPRGTFGMAGVGTVRVVGDASGIVTASLAPGVPYDLHLHDPRGHETERLAAPLLEQNKTAANVLAVYTLPKAVKVRGSLSLAGNPVPIGNAAVQILCATGVTCTGTQRALPLAEGPTAANGKFEVGVLDPGTM